MGDSTLFRLLTALFLVVLGAFVLRIAVAQDPARPIWWIVAGMLSGETAGAACGILWITIAPVHWRRRMHDVYAYLRSS